MPVRPAIQPFVSADGQVAFQNHEIATEFSKAYCKHSVHVNDNIKSEEKVNSNHLLPVTDKQKHHYQRSEC